MMPTVTLPPAWHRRRRTPSEQEVMALVAAGISLKEAAVCLGKPALTVSVQLPRPLRPPKKLIQSLRLAT